MILEERQAQLPAEVWGVFLGQGVETQPQALSKTSSDGPEPLRAALQRASLLLNSPVFLLLSAIQEMLLGEGLSVLQPFLLSDNSSPLTFLNKPFQRRTPKNKHISPQRM